MTDAVADTQVATPRARPRFLQWPLMRVLLAILFVAVPFVLLQVVLHKLPIDKSLKQIWPALLSVACCYFMYRVYVRVVEQRTASEFAGNFAARETGLGFIGGALLFGATLGALYVAGAYRVTAIAVRARDRLTQPARSGLCSPARKQQALMRAYACLCVHAFPLFAGLRRDAATPRKPSASRAMLPGSGTAEAAVSVPPVDWSHPPTELPPSLRARESAGPWLKSQETFTKVS